MPWTGSHARKVRSVKDPARTVSKSVRTHRLCSLQPGLHGGQVVRFLIVRDEGFSGWLRFGSARGDHMLIMEIEHGIAGCAVMFFVTVAPPMRDTPLLPPINAACEVAHEETATGLVDRAVPLLFMQLFFRCQ